MATGLYTDAGFEADEGAPELWAFMTRTTHEGRIAQACAEHPRQAEPGTRWVYHTTDTYVLGTAMQAFWRARQGRWERPDLALPRPAACNDRSTDLSASYTSSSRVSLFAALSSL